MPIYKIKAFSKWAQSEGMSDGNIAQAVQEMNNGLFEANLGGNLYKKRVATGGGGKRGGFRTLLAFKSDEKAFFLYGFKKNARSNISDKEAVALKAMAKELLGYSPDKLKDAVDAGELVEVKGNG